jgi:hypothetical protein
VIVSTTSTGIHSGSPFFGERRFVDAENEYLLGYCTANRIDFIPWYPLAAGELTRSGGLVDRIAKAHYALPIRRRPHGCCSAARSFC